MPLLARPSPASRLVKAIFPRVLKFICSVISITDCVPYQCIFRPNFPHLFIVASESLEKYELENL